MLFNKGTKITHHFWRETKSSARTSRIHAFNNVIRYRITECNFWLTLNQNIGKRYLQNKFFLKCYLQKLFTLTSDCYAEHLESSHRNQGPEWVTIIHLFLSQKKMSVKLKNEILFWSSVEAPNNEQFFTKRVDHMKEGTSQTWPYSKS